MYSFNCMKNCYLFKEIINILLVNNNLEENILFSS